MSNKPAFWWGVAFTYAAWIVSYLLAPPPPC